MIPTWNRAELLRQALGSVLGQEVESLEVVVSDNASTDETPQVVSSFEDRRITYMRLETNIGANANLSRCLSLGTAPIIGLLQDDDLMLPGNLAAKLQVLARHPRAAFVHGDFRYIDERGEVLADHVSWWDSSAEVESPLEFARGSMRTGVRVDMSSALIRRELLGDERFEVGDGVATDYGLFLRLSQRGDVVHVARPLIALRRHRASLSVMGETELLPAGHYAPSIDYTTQCREINERYLARLDADPSQVKALRRSGRQWARRELAAAVRASAGPEPELRRTLALLRRAATVDRLAVLRRRALLTLAWALIGRRGRHLLRRSLPRLARQR